MILQTDGRLRAEINTFGCYLMCLVFLANKHAGIRVDTDRIEEFYQECMRKGWMTPQCFVSRPELILGHLGLPVQFTGRHEEPDRNCYPDEVEILRFERPRKPSGIWGHFVVGDGRGHVAYDSMGVARTVREGTLMSKRIFRLLSAPAVSPESGP